jgi:hypothetical protein
VLPQRSGLSPLARRSELLRRLWGEVIDRFGARSVLNHSTHATDRLDPELVLAPVM